MKRWKHDPHLLHSILNSWLNLFRLSFYTCWNKKKYDCSRILDQESTDWYELGQWNFTHYVNYSLENTCFVLGWEHVKCKVRYCKHHLICFTIKAPHELLSNTFDWGLQFGGLKSDISRLRIICTVILHIRFLRCENFTEMSNFHLLNKILATQFECEWCFWCRFETEAAKHYLWPGMDMYNLI